MLLGQIKNALDYLDAISDAGSDMEVVVGQNPYPVEITYNII